jgi:subtilisin-like proprotein convertase family protein
MSSVGLRLAAAAGVVVVGWAAGMAAADPPKREPAKSAALQAVAAPSLEKRAVGIGPDVTDEMIQLKEALAARDNVAPAGGLRGPGPVNDLCAGATDLNAPPFNLASGQTIVVNDNNTGATSDGPGAANATECGFTNSSQTSGALGLWYKFVGTGNYVEFSTCQQATDMTIRMYCGPDCSTLTCVGADDDGCVTNSLGSRLGVCTAPGQTYFVLIARYGTATAGAAFAFTVVDSGAPCGATTCGVPANDDCANAQPMTVGQTVRGNTSAATSDTAAQTGCGASATTQRGVWFRVAGTGDVLQASTCTPNTGSNTIISVFSGVCGSLTCIGNNATTTCGASVRDDTAVVVFPSTAGVDVYILVSNDTNGAGEFALAVTSLGPPISNDTCATATPVSLPSTTPATNVGATNDAGLPTCSGLSTWNNGVWFRFTGNGNRVSASTCHPNTVLNTRVYVFTGSCAAPVCVGANATASPACTPSTAATVTFCAAAGQEYYVLVTNDTTGTGAFTLVISDLGPVGCVPTGACCAAGGCTVTTQAACTGTWLGANTSCIASASPSLAIPDLTTVTSTIVVPPGGPTISSLRVPLMITHTWQGDLRVDLTHQDTGTTVTLIDRPGVPQVSTVGFSADNYGDAGANLPFVVDDASTNLYDSAGGPNCGVATCSQVAPGTNNVSGSWHSDAGPMSAFSGQSLSGTWILTIADLAGGDIGTLTFWALDSTPAWGGPCPTGPDCFTRGSAGPVGPCPPNLTYNRPVAPAGHFTMGGASGVPDDAECKVDWNGDGCRTPADVAGFVSSWFYSAQNPGNTDGDYNCDNTATPSDVAAFVSNWFDSITNPATYGC